VVTIESQIFRGLLYNEEYARKVYPFLEDSYFDGSHKTFFQIYKQLFDKYNKQPTIESIAVTVGKLPLSESEYEEILSVVEDSSKSGDVDTDWLVDETEEYCKDKAIYNAIYQSINIIDGSDSKLDKHAIPDLLDDALSVSFDTSIGMEFFDDAERRYEMYTADDSRIPLPTKALMYLTNGGLKPKSLSCTLAFTNAGKSALMCFMASELMKAGFDVLYISLEMSEDTVYERIEANILNLKTDELKHLKKEDYLKKISSIKSKTNGKLFVKEYPTSSAHVGHFRHLLKELKQKKKFKPKVIFVDYINICASSRYKSMNGVNSYSYVKAIAEELRGLAVEFEVPIWTGTQTNRDNANSSSPDMTATSESIGLPQTLDFFMAQTTDEVMMENGKQLWHLLKTRWGNKSSVKPQLVNVDFDHMRFSDIDEYNDQIKDVQSKVGQTKPQKKVESSAIDFD
jgi:replicative DNA helicase